MQGQICDEDNRTLAKSSIVCVGNEPSDSTYDETYLYEDKDYVLTFGDCPRTSKLYFHLLVEESNSHNKSFIVCVGNEPSGSTYDETYLYEDKDYVLTFGDCPRTSKLYFHLLVKESNSHSKSFIVCVGNEPKTNRFAYPEVAI